jgi:hypothetical protein
MVMTGDLVIILDTTTGEMVGRCDGPDQHGKCPQVPSGNVVPCAGDRIVPATGGTQRYRLHVPSGSVGCPLSWILESEF